MSAIGGRADVACQGLSGPFLANSGHLSIPVQAARQFRKTASPSAFQLGARFVSEAGVARGLTTILTANVVGYPQIRPHALARLRRLA